ncbi:hypothetical protein EXIGLDRAFT_767309, partial [Exidia glandulosa HHB12029]
MVVIQIIDVLTRKIYNPILRLRKRLLRDHLLPPWTSVDTPRTYIYSVGDELINVEDVEDHAADAAAKGVYTRLE